MSRRTAWKLAPEHGWDLTFDAEYLAACKLQADALVTIDRALGEKAVGIVPTAPLGVLSSGSSQHTSPTRNRRYVTLVRRRR